MWHALIRLTAALAITITFAAAFAADKGAASKEQLAQMQQLVGAWRGVGQPQRGSMTGSWVEEADWAWSFANDGPSLVAKLPKTKYFSRLQLSAGERAGHFQLTATPAAGGAPIVYSGQLDDQNQLVLTADQPREHLPQRLSFRFVAEGNRLLILMEKRNSSSGQFTRLAEVGYTRQGSGFGKATVQRECVVTGGLGTIAVMHNGQTYYVCCTGCRDYFNDQPDAVLAEHAARKEAEKAKRDEPQP